MGNLKQGEGFQQKQETNERNEGDTCLEMGVGVEDVIKSSLFQLKGNEFHHA